MSNIAMINSHRTKYRLIENILLAAAFAAFIVSMLPVYRLGAYDRMAMDDYSYGEYAHAAWVSTHSVLEVLKAACRKVYEIYYSWQGTWFSVFLFGLHPAVFNFDAYGIVPYLMTGMIILTMSLFLYEILAKRFGLTVKQYIFCDLLLLFLYMQFEPYTYCAMYWWVGAAHYVVPLALCFLALTLTSRFLRSGRAAQFVGICACTVLVSGSNYLAAFFLPLGAALLIVSDLLPDFKMGNGKAAFKRKRIGLFAIPLLLEFAGMLISVLAPGNFVRKDVDLSVGAYFVALGQAMIKGTAGTFEFLVQKPVTSVAFVVLAAVVWFMICVNGQDLSGRFKHPVLFVLYIHLARCIIYWPEIFSGDSVSGGVANMYYQTYVLCTFLCIVYVMSWLYGFLQKKKIGEFSPDHYINAGVKLLAGTVICSAAVVVLLGKPDLKTSAAYTAYDMLRSGRAEQYAQMISLQNEMLEYPEGDIVTVPIDGEDFSPFVYSAPTQDPENWENAAMARYYGLEKVYGKPKDAAD